MRKYDYLIVGSGVYGSTFAFCAHQRGKSCLLIEKRKHLGGNVYCENYEGINVHKYGAHIFHTSSKRVWDFVTSLVDFNRFTNAPVARFKGRLYNLPFNMNTFNQIWGVTTPEEAMTIIEEQKLDALESMRKAGISEPRNLEEQSLLLIGRDVYEILIKGYTEKQWGRKCNELPASIIKRLPVRFVYDNNYFNDSYQGIPIGGYNKLINCLLNNVEVRVETDFFDNREYWKSLSNEIVYTGAIDQFFDYRLGKLDWRTVSFEEEILTTPNFQGNAVVNYTDTNVPFTRIIEHKHFEMFGDDVYRCPVTVISKEFPSEYKDGMEPYYCINNKRNDKLASQYRELALLENNVVFGGRLAEYRYYDMAPIIENVLRYFNML